MPRILGVVGYQNSGKTTLIRALAQELRARGQRVAIVKHTHHPLDLPHKDTALLGENVEQVALISPHEAALFWKRPASLEEVIPHLQADVILVEGFKHASAYPKIACLRGEPDDGDLFDEHVICAVAPRCMSVATDAAAGKPPVLSRDDIAQIADLIQHHVAP